MDPVTVHPALLAVLAGLALLAIGVAIGVVIPRKSQICLHRSPRLTFMPVRINAVLFGLFMLAAFIVATVVAIDFLREGLRLLGNEATAAEGVNQIMLAVIAQNALYVLLSGLAGPLGELCKQSDDSR